MSRIEAKPTDGLAYSPLEPHYFDPDKLQAELDRCFDICHGCRLCFNLCPSFPALFDYTDAHEGDVRKITKTETDYVIDTCFQCKICYVKCPYTPDENHDFQLDFPRLLQRAKIVRARKEGVAFREKLLGNPDLLGKLSGILPAIANLANRIPINRFFLEKILGIHRKKLLPEFHGTTFMKWARGNQPKPEGAGENGKVAYYPTCFVNYNKPEIGKAALRVFAKNNLDVTCTYDGCCGMPALDGGNLEKAQEQAEANIKRLMPLVREGRKILVNNPTCSMMMRKEYPELVPGQEAVELAAAVMDPNEYLHALRKEGKLNENYQSTPGRIQYHVPCHLRAQNIGYRSRDVMKRIGGETEVELVDECCGHDGTWAMKKEFFEMSLKTGKKAFDGMAGEKVPAGSQMSTDCPLAAIHFKQATGSEPLHPLEILDRAYRPDGFPTAIEPAKDEG